jgi:hypothetical protein
MCESAPKGDGRFDARYLRMAEISVGQSAPQLRDAPRSAFSHTAKPISTITVITSLARVLSLISAPHFEPAARSLPVPSGRRAKLSSAGSNVAALNGARRSQSITENHFRQRNATPMRRFLRHTTLQE